KVAVAPSASKLGPGEKAQIAVSVTDAQGTPVADAEAAVIVVDEAILSLTGHQFANPLDTFYRGRSPDTRDAYSQAYIKLAKPDAGSLPADKRFASSNPALNGAAASAEAPPPPPAPPGAMPESRMDQPKAEGQLRVAGNAQASAPIAIRSNFN